MYPRLKPPASPRGDVIYYCLHLNLNTLISCIATCLETSNALPVTSLYCKSLKHRKSTVSMAKRSRCPARNQKVASVILSGDIYFHFEFFACFPSLQVSRAVANESSMTIHM